MDWFSDRANCGACNNACPAPDASLHVASVGCDGGVCAVESCLDGCVLLSVPVFACLMRRGPCSYADGDGDLDNGCEALAPNCKGAPCTSSFNGGCNVSQYRICGVYNLNADVCRCRPTLASIARSIIGSARRSFLEAVSVQISQLAREYYDGRRSKHTHCDYSTAGAYPGKLIVCGLGSLSSCKFTPLLCFAGDGLCSTGCETSVQSNVNNCGACNTACPAADASKHVASVKCSNGACVVGSCLDG